MAEARPSKVGATWASNTTGSIRTGFRPAWCSARASVAPAMPAPAMMTSTPLTASAMGSAFAHRGLVLGKAHDVETGVHMDQLASRGFAEVGEQPQRTAGDALHGGVLLHGGERAALGQHSPTA